MPKLLCKVTETFAIQGRGVVAILENDAEWRIPRDEVVNRREVIRVLRPDETSVKTFIKDFEFVTRAGGKSDLAITFPKNVTLEDVPPHSMIFLEREDGEAILWDGVSSHITKPAEQDADDQAAADVDSKP
ncbi:MAG: hypothetical protein AAF591_18750 [Verrucomicrobiota bacterium]